MEIKISVTDIRSQQSSEKKNPNNIEKRIGVARNINFPANFDEIDYRTAEWFGLND